MGAIDAETSVLALGGGRYRTRLEAAWNIGSRPNGGYALMPAIRAMLDVSAHPDPLSITAHFLRPATGGRDAELMIGTLRSGRSMSNATATIAQDGTLRIAAQAVVGSLAAANADPDPCVGLVPPDLPPPERCVDRREVDQGVDLPILSRLDVRIRPEQAVAASSRPAVVEGWIRLADGTPPDTLVLPLFADAFPPALHTPMGPVGWVPTIELTVHVHRRPTSGWVLARFECDDLQGGRMIESGTLWDSAGAVVARSRQLGLVQPR